jgi:hypothetical protein
MSPLSLPVKASPSRLKLPSLACHLFFFQVFNQNNYLIKLCISEERQRRFWRVQNALAAGCISSAHSSVIMWLRQFCFPELNISSLNGPVAYERLPNEFSPRQNAINYFAAPHSASFCLASAAR